MSHRVILASTGAELTVGRSRVRALSGPHKGAWFTLNDVQTAKGEHTVHASRRTRAGVHHVRTAPDVFGLIVEEIATLARHALNVAVHMRRKMDDGLILGALALVPLAVFEAFHGGEVTRHILESLLNSRASSAGEGGH